MHISLTRFNDIVIHEDSETVEIGAGLTWADAYAYLVPKGVNVVGGRLGGAGVAGYTLGGGKPSANSSVIRTQDITRLERVFLEDKSVWAHSGHHHGV